MTEYQASLDLPTASAYAQQALGGITREYPNAPQLMLAGPEGLQTNRALHPAFYGCFDWHSAVHSHWLLVRLLRLFPELPEAAEIRAILHAHLSAANLQTEAGYFNQPYHTAFERMYGWAWLLKLDAELAPWDDPDGRAWFANLQPLSQTIVKLLRDFLPVLTYPVRVGTHTNTAFSLTLALDYARQREDTGLEKLLVDASLRYFGEDKAYPAGWEPGGGDFLSPALAEADLLSRILPQAEFGRWFDGFLPAIPDALLHPVTVLDPSDPADSHLNGLQLSRAWAMRRIAHHLPEGSAVRPVLLEAAAQHAQAGLPQAITHDFMGAHWLATFAVYLQTIHLDF